MNTLTTIITLLIFPGGLCLLLLGLAYEWVDRKLVARLQNRVGPRWFQPLADTIKLLAKEEVVPENVQARLFTVLPVIALAGALTSALYVPLFGLNNAFQQIPILGPLLGGREGEGLVGVTFAVQGPLNNPQFRINPLSILMPGVFRELFEFRAKELPQVE